MGADELSNAPCTTVDALMGTPNSTFGGPTITTAHSCYRFDRSDEELPHYTTHHPLHRFTVIQNKCIEGPRLRVTTSFGVSKLTGDYDQIIYSGSRNPVFNNPPVS